MYLKFGQKITKARCCIGQTSFLSVSKHLYIINKTFLGVTHFYVYKRYFKTKFVYDYTDIFCILAAERFRMEKTL